MSGKLAFYLAGHDIRDRNPLQELADVLVQGEPEDGRWVAAADPVSTLLIGGLFGISGILDGPEYLANGDFLGRTLQPIATAGASGRHNQSGTAEHCEQLFEVGERNLLSFSDFREGYGPG